MRTLSAAIFPIIFLFCESKTLYPIFIFEVKPLHSHIIIEDKRDKVNNRDKSTLEIIHSVRNIKQQISHQL